MFVGKQIWDPWLICRQIAVLQVAFYVGLFTMQLVFAAAFLPRISPVFMFQPAAVGLHSFVAMMMALAYILNACVSAIAIRLVVARAKKCWDFGATIYLFHFGFTWLVDGFPQRATWWILMAGCGTVTVLLGEFLCVQFEMADIPITGLGALRQKKAKERDQADVEAQIPLKSLAGTSSP